MIGYNSRYHTINAADAKRKQNEKYEEDYYEYEEEHTVMPVRDSVVVVEPEDEVERMVNATNCGRKGGTRSPVTTHVVGGAVARENEIPWHVSMLRSGEGWHGCSATLLSCDPAIILTAAHCVE